MRSSTGPYELHAPPTENAPADDDPATAEAALHADDIARAVAFLASDDAASCLIKMGALPSKYGHSGLDGSGDAAVDDEVGAGDEAGSRTE